MWTYVCPTRPDELYHHGIRGMKWGVRRFQNSDGSLTAAGKKRISKIEGKEAKLAEKKAALTGGKSASFFKVGTTKKKSPKDMTDEELQKANDRMQAEITYYERYAKLNPKKISAGKKFADKFADKALENVAQGAAKSIGNTVEKQLSSVLDKAFDSAMKKK